MKAIWVPENPDLRLPEDLVLFLQEKGFVNSSLIEAALDGDSRDSADDLLAALEAPLIKSMTWSKALVVWMVSGGEASAKRQRTTGILAPLDVKAAVVAAAASSARTTITTVINAVLDDCVKTAVWRTRRQKDLSLAAGPQERADIERKERERWLVQVIEILQEANLPVIAFAAMSTSADLALRHVAGVRKAKTLRARVRTWSKARVWLLLVHETSWPRHLGHMLDYLQDLESMGCARTVPRSVFLALLFFETAGAVEPGKMISNNKLWQAAVNDVEAQVVARVGTEVRRAPPFFLIMLLSLELYVVSDRPKYHRFLAWVRLIKVYACLRYDDCRGIPPSRLRLTNGGLRGVIVASKTTGPSKKVWEAPFFVHRLAGFSGHDWLQQGFDILSSSEFCFARDYLVPMPSLDWQGTIQKVLDYSTASAHGRSLLLDLRSPVLTEVGLWEESADSALMVAPAHLFFTEHSERHVLASWSASLGIDKTRRDYLGRWAIGAHGSNDYVQCSRLAVLGVQKEICEALSAGTDKVDEYDLVDALKAFLKKREVEESDIQEAISKLALSPVDQAWFGLGQQWPLKATSEAQEIPAPVEPEDETMMLVPLSAESAKQKLRSQSEGSPFWVSLTRKRKYRRLHRRNGCWLDPKVDCWDYEQIDNLEGIVVDAKCINCFGKPGEPSSSKSPSEIEAGGDPEEQHSAEESSSSEEEAGRQEGPGSAGDVVGGGAEEVIELDEL
jgi:hypothetical protein